MSDIPKLKKHRENLLSLEETLREFDEFEALSLCLQLQIKVNNLIRDITVIETAMKDDQK